MISAYAALLSAFSGTVLKAYQPYSQFLPSMLYTGMALGFMLAIYRKRGRTAASALT
jgi:hypothetical protein